MNKIYKVMYSKVKQCCVVVSEIAKSHGHNGESSGVRKHAALTAAVLIALGSLSFTTAFVPMTAEAADKTRTDGSDFVGVERTDGLFEDSDYANYKGQGAHGADSITIGLKASGSDGTITIGDRRAEKSLGSVYVGRGPGMPTGKVLPSGTDDGYWATSVGYQSDATGYGSIAIGSNATANNSYDKDSTGHGILLRTPSGDGKSFVLNGKPDIQRASVAIGYGASADNGNIAIGSYSDASTDLHGKEINSYLTNKKADSYVSVGKSDALRRISNVADGAANSDVATIAQLKEAVKETDASKKANIDASNIGKNLKFKADGKTAANSSDITTNEDAWGEAIGTGKVEEKNGQLVTGGTVYSALENQKKDLVHPGWGINIADEKDPKTGEVTKKNVISLNRNLGTNLDKTGHVHLDVSDTGLVLGTVVNSASGTDMDLHYGATGDYAVTVGGGANTASGKASVVLGGSLNEASNEATVASGGNSNVASGSMAAVYGGSYNEASGADATILGGELNKASNTWTAVGGGSSNEASGIYASVWGGSGNNATDNSAAVYGGSGNSAYGSYSAILGGGSNKAGVVAVVSGGASNEAAGIESAVLGGVGNIVTGANATAVGGVKGSVNGVGSVGILGGSTGINAPFTLAAGYQSTVTDTGVTSTPITEEEAEKFQEEGTHPGLVVGSNDPDNLSFKILDHFATAVGYQATADEAQTVAFGHDKGDTYYGTTTYTWKQKATVKDGHYYDEYNQEISKESYESLKNADGTWNDYSQPIATVEEKKYDSAYYNRLVKVADGIEDHDAVVMEQLKNASDVGSHIKVYKTDTNGNVQFDENNKPIEDTSGAAKTTRDAAQKASEDAWGEAIGTGKVEANNSQLVTGDTVYNAIQNQAEWKLTTNDESADKAAAIKPGTTVNFSAEKNGKDHSNVTISHNGSNVTIGLDKDIVLGDTSPSRGGSLNVYADSSDGNNLSNHVSINGSTISVNYPKSNGDKNTPIDTRGVILGVGEEDSKPDGYIAFNNVEGAYTYLHASTDASDDKKGRLEYVGSDGNKKYIANLDDVSTAVNNAKTKYYAVNEKAPLMNLDTYKNEGNDGAKGMGSLAAGFVTHADGIASTVVGSYSGVIGSWLQGAAAVSVGTVNVNNNTGTSKAFSGVANSIVGQANMTTDSNAAIIVGAGNRVTNSYRDLDPEDALSKITSAVISKDANALKEALQDAVPKSGGQVMVMGGGNNVESAYMSQVVGVGNTVKGNQVKNTEGEWATDTSDTAIKDYDSEKSSQYNYVDGFNNEVINGKHDYIIGANNKLDGDSYDDNNAKPIKRSNKSNVVIGDNHALTGKKNNVIIGSADTEGTLTRASDAVIIGHNANATSDTGADNAVAIGLSATAGGGNAVTIGVNTSAGDNSITIGSESSAISGSNIAIGRYARVYGDKVTNAVALGQKAEAQVTDGVAIGSNSIATVAGNSVEGYDPTTGRTSTDTTGTWQATKAAVSIGTADGKVTRQINGVAAGTNDTDAVNVAQIKKLASINASNIGANLQYGADGTTAVTDTDKTKNKEAWATAIGTGTVTKDDDGSKQMVTGKTVYDALHGGLDNITVGKDGQNGKDGSIGIAGQNGKDGYSITYIKTEQGAAGVDGKDGITRVVYQDKDGNGKHTFATLDDGLKFKGDDSTVIAKKLNEQLNITGGADSTNLTDKNIGVNSSTDGLKIQLAKNLAGITSIANQTTTGKGDAQTTTGAKIDLKDDGSISVNSGKITDVKSGLTATDGTYADTDKNNAANIGDVHSMIEKEAGNTDDKLALKANVAADNIGTHITDTTAQKTNLDNWGAAIGTGAVADSTNEHANQLVTGKTVYDALHGGLDNITVGKDGQNGKDGSIGIAGQNGKDGYSITYIKTEQGAAGVDGKDGITRVVYQDKDGNGKHTFATLDDGLKFKGDDSTVIAKKLNEQLNITGGADSTNLTDKNIGVNSSTDGLKIQLAKNLTSITSISGSTDTNGAKITLDENDKNISVNGGSIKDVASNLTKDGKIINGSDNNAASISDVQTLVQQGVDNGYTHGDGITIQKDGTSGKNVISVNQGDGLKFDSGKLAVNTGDGLTVDETTKALKIKTSDSNLKVDRNGIGLNNVITIGTAGTNAHPITIDGTKGEVSGLNNTSWDSKADYSKSTKAATESQVDAAVKDAVKQAGENDIHVAAGSYAVNDQNQVSMNLVDKNNDTKGTVIITDVAKSSEMGDVSKLADGVKNAGGKTTTVVDAINNVNTSMNTKIGDQKYSTSNTSGSNKYVQDGDSITSAIGKLDGAVQQATTAAGQHSTVSAGSNITVTPAKQTDGHTDYQVALNKDITVDSVTAKTATTDTLTVKNSATIGGVTIANKTISGLDDTKIEKGSTNAVNAGTIWNELRPSGGTYINQNNTTAQNIMNLDTQVKKNSDLVNSDGSTIKIGGKDSATKVDISDKNGSGRVVTGVVSDANDPTSAANVGYVNGVTSANTQQIYRDMNNAYGRLNNNINKAAAGSNALAALHPLDYDPDDKADFAVGYGHYRNANAAAVGAFYHPNENTMVNVGVSLGNGDPGFNAGVSFKVGRGGAGREAMSKTEMAKVINSQSKEIDALKKDNADKDKRIDALEQKMAEILAKLDKNGK